MTLDVLPPAIESAFAAGGGFAAVLLTGKWLLTWVTARLDRRQALLDTEHQALDMSWKDYRLLLERRLASVERQNRALLTAFHHVTAGLIKRDPQAPELMIAERVMAGAFPTDFSTITDMAEAAISGVGRQRGASL